MTATRIQTIYETRDDLISNHLRKNNQYVQLQKELWDLKNGAKQQQLMTSTLSDFSSTKHQGEVSLQMSQFVDKMAKKIKDLQFIDD